ncbi:MULTISPECIES: sigma-70 family RNA polymerase sigma factor [unclassified Yoonia]|uniref:sigma-70 family RNA polymerase sigma factor n=1 Tax=unclassified Yoonia TaxID=2629118 RepID=UPI002AFF6039|nr:MULTISPECIES: sigma-70 family RNA polymerase sigma factor [unclassified Yoonia]
MIKQHAFHVLLPQQSLALHRRALKLTSDKHRADDLVQETLLKAWAKRDSFRPDTHLRAWLFTILRNTFFSDLRKYRREVEDADGALADGLSEQPRQDHAIAMNELLSAIALLPDVQRKPVVLMGVYGFSQLEAAAACGCTVGTIKSRVSRGRTALSHAVAHDFMVDRRPSSARTRIKENHSAEPKQPTWA